ncbi:MAG: outer membrane protein assembly factor BamD [bacterium]
MPTRHWIIIPLALAVLAALPGCSALRSADNSDATAEELYAIAKESLERKNWLTAVEQLRALEAKYPYGAHAEQAQLDTIYAHHRNNEPGLAIAAAERFIKLHPAHPSVDYAYYLKGLANYQQDDSLFGRLTGRDDLSDRDASISREALNAFTDVYTRFPDSRYAADARARARSDRIARQARVGGGGVLLLARRACRRGQPRQGHHRDLR